MTGKTDSSAASAADYVTREEAIGLLDVKAATLYTYVSRGLVRRILDPVRRRSLYHREDLDRVRARSGARAADGVVASGAMRYGEPIVTTSITELTAAGPRYRNRSALELAAANVPFEDVAELLWTGRLAEVQRPWALEPLPAVFLDMARGLPSGEGHAAIDDLFALCTLALGMSKGRPAERANDSVSHAADVRQLLQALTGCFAVLRKPYAYRPPQSGESVALSVAHSLGTAPSPKTLRLLNAALTVSADHELNPATFVARIAASSEVDLYSCVAAALCTRIARGCDRLEQWLREERDPRNLQAQLTDEYLGSPAKSGFNHPLYPQGDPRGRFLLDLTFEALASTEDLRRIRAFIETAGRRHKLFPRIELALAVTAFGLRLPPGSAAGLYTLGRIAGWIAHVNEQRLAGYLIRPRARYAGHAVNGPASLQQPSARS
jgi:citrate synthase